MNSHRLAVCVPYRDRQAHLEQFVPHMEAFLGSQGIDYRIYIVHQRDKNMFNRGALKNVGFALAKRDNCDHVVFHDIDMLPIECDYSFPSLGPTHLATGVDSYEGKLAYLTYFGGVVIFSREHFEQVNGYCNTYWGWGYEDDDLLSRCVLEGLIKGEYLSVRSDQFTSARFNGQTSKALLFSNDNTLNKLDSSDYSIDILTRPDPIVFRKNFENIPFRQRFGEIAIPLLARHCLPLLSYTESLYLGNHIDSENNLTTITCRRRPIFNKRKDFEWDHLTYIVNNGEQSIYTLLNGNIFDVWRRNAGDKITQKPSRPYYGTPLCIGFDDSPMGNFFQGEIGRVALWNHALEVNELKSYISNKDANYWNTGNICVFDFSEDHQALNNMYLSTHDLERHVCELDHIEHVPVPFRRKCLFHNIDIRDEGQKRIVDGAWTQRNAEHFAKFQSGLIEHHHSGLSDLFFNVKGESLLSTHTTMIDVELDFGRMNIE
jgi:hypothetical protein